MMEFGTMPRVVTWTAAGCIGAAGLAGCGGGSEATPNAPVQTGAGVHEGAANRCELTLERSGSTFIGHAVVNGTIPGGSELVYQVRYKATWQDGSYSTSDTRIPAEGTMSGQGVLKVNDQDREFFGFSGKIDLKGSRVNLPCRSVNLDDLR